jgi:hypothetical protein
MKYTEKQKQSAKDLYVRGNKSQKEIAEMLSIPTSTLTGWVKKGNWEQERASLSLSVDNMIPKILGYIDKKIDEDTLSGDDMAKYCKQLREFSKIKLTINDYYEIMVKFIDSLRRQAVSNHNITPQVLQIVVEAQDKFMKQIAGDEQ